MSRRPSHTDPLVLTGLPSPPRAVLLACTLAALLTPPVAHAANRYWKNSVPSGDWHTGSNWSATSPLGADNAGVPNIDNVFITPNDVATHNVNITSGSATALSINVTAPSIFPSIIANLNISGPTGLFGTDLLTNFLTVGSAGAGNYGNGAVNHTGGQVSIVGGGNALVLGFAGTNRGAYHLSGTGSLNIQGDSVVGISGGAGTFTQDGGNAFLHGNLSVGASGAGSFSISAGSLQVDAKIFLSQPASAPAGSSSSFVQTGGTVSTNAIDIGGASNTAPSSYNISGGTLNVIGASGITFAGSGAGFASLDISGTATVNVPFEIFFSSFPTTATINLSSGTLATRTITFRGASPLNWTGGTLHLTAGLALDSVPASPIFSPAPLFGSALTLTAGKTLRVTGNQTIGGVGLFDLALYDGSANLVSGTLTVSPTGSLTVNPGATLSYATLAHAGGPIIGNITNNAHFSHTSGLFIGRLTNNGTVNFGPDFSPSNGILNLTSFSLTTGQTLSADGQGLDNQGAITLAGGTLAGAGPLVNNSSLTGAGTIAGDAGVTNNGHLSPTATLTLANVGPNINNNLITLAPLARLTISADSNLTNAATLSLNSGSLTGPGPLTNSPTGIILGPGAISAPLTNLGTLLAPAGITSLPSFTNAGTLALDSPAARIPAGPTITNNALLAGRGTLAASLVNNAVVEPAAGTLTLAGTLTNSPTGDLRAPTSAKLLITGPFPTNSGTVSLLGGTVETTAPLSNPGIIQGQGTLRTPALTNSNKLTLTGGTANIFGPVTNAPTGRILITGAATATFYSPLTLQPGSNLKISTGATATFLAPVTGQANITLEGGGTANFESPGNTFAPSSVISAPDLHVLVTQTASLSAPAFHLHSLTSLGPTTLLPSSPQSTLTTLDLSTTGTLDLSNNSLLITSTPITLIRQYLHNNQLTSSTPDPTDTHSLGFLTTPSGTLIKLTLTGDANLDNSLTLDDFALLDRGYLTAGQFWSQGDFNYDGTVNNQDYLLLDRTYALTHALSPTLLAARHSQFGPNYVSQLLTSIPEPTLTLSFILYPLSPLLLARSRRDPVATPPRQ